MAGEALTTEFALSTATLMLGPQATMFDLQPTAHSLGLVKNIKIKSDPEFKELTQGIQNKVVFSVKTGSKTMVSAEVYEYTRRNVAYALGLNAGVNTVATVVATTLGVASTSGAATLTVVSGTGFVANDYVLLADPVFPDRSYIRRVLSVAANVITFTTNLPAVVLPIGTTVARIGTNDIGASDVGQQFFSCKISGFTAEGKPAIFVFPKVRVTSGLDYNFTSDDFGNMPLELGIYDLVPADPHYDLMGNRQGLMLG